ncbi:hypothetical protein YPPY55_4886, partial [Yersinia pestis PY-55]
MTSRSRSTSTTSSLLAKDGAR